MALDFGALLGRPVKVSRCEFALAGFLRGVEVGKIKGGRLDMIPFFGRNVGSTVMFRSIWSHTETGPVAFQKCYTFCARLHIPGGS